MLWSSECNPPMSKMMTWLIHSNFIFELSENFFATIRKSTLIGEKGNKRTEQLMVANEHFLDKFKRHAKKMTPNLSLLPLWHCPTPQPHTKIRKRSFQFKLLNYIFSFAFPSPLIFFAFTININTTYKFKHR